MGVRRAFAIISSLLMVGGTIGALGGNGAGATLSAVQWKIQPSPNPAGNRNAHFGGVACPAANSCVAVGYSGDRYGATSPRRLAQRWDGQTWTTWVTPATAGNNPDAFADVACMNTTSCTAVGSTYPVTTASRALIDHWNGSGWSIQPSPAPAHGYAELYTIACPSSTACFAGGSVYSQSGPLIERWNGTSWSLQQFPNDPERNLIIQSIACASATNCMAVGEAALISDPSPWADAIVEHWNGSAWSTQQLAPVSGGSRATDMQSVACTSAMSCIAVGYSFDVDQSHDAINLRRLVERWDGHVWSIVNTPAASGAGENVFTGISCTSSANCVVVGYYTVGAYNPTTTLAERWNGAAWTIESTPNRTASNELDGVACNSSRICTAVGSDTTSANASRTLIERSG